MDLLQNFVSPPRWGDFHPPTNPTPPRGSTLELITSKITTLYNVCELARPDPTKTEKKQVEKVNPNIKYVHEKLFCVELEQKDIDKLKSVSYGNVQGLKTCLKVKNG